MPKETGTFEQFWIYYLSEHSKKGANSAFHWHRNCVVALIPCAVLFRLVVAIIDFAVGYTLASIADFSIEA